MMQDSEYQQALMPGDGKTPAKLTVAQKENWNNFIDYLDKSGYKGSTDLDNRDTQLGKSLLSKYNAAHPNAQVQYEDIPHVQSELQDYRQALVNKWKAGKASPDDSVKTEDDLMPGLSQVDGWLGSKTSSYKFPSAMIIHSNGTTQNLGVNTDLYDKLIQQKSK